MKLDLGPDLSCNTLHHFPRFSRSALFASATSRHCTWQVLRHRGDRAEDDALRYRGMYDLEPRTRAPRPVPAVPIEHSLASTHRFDFILPSAIFSRRHSYLIRVLDPAIRRPGNQGSLSLDHYQSNDPCPQWRRLLSPFMSVHRHSAVVSTSLLRAYRAAAHLIGDESYFPAQSEAKHRVAQAVREPSLNLHVDFNPSVTLLIDTDCLRSLRGLEIPYTVS